MPNWLETLFPFAALATVAGAAWAIRDAIGKLELAIQGHVTEDRATHQEMNTRLVRVERLLHIRDTSSPDVSSTDA